MIRFFEALADRLRSFWAYGGGRNDRPPPLKDRMDRRSHHRRPPGSLRRDSGAKRLCPAISWRWVASGRGRAAAASDTAKAPPVAIINETVAQMFQDEDPVGRRIAFDSPADA